MEKSNFKKFCHDRFTEHGFKKHRSTYYLASSHGLLCGLTLQGSYGTAYYINCDFFIGNFEDPKSYPSQYDSDLYDRPICVLSKTTYKGEHFMTALIEYEKYTEEELQPFFDQAFNNRIMPPLQNGKQELLMHLDEWELPDSDTDQLDTIRKKLSN